MTPTPTPGGFSNASSTISNGLGSAVGLAGSVIVAISLAVLVHLALTSYERYKLARYIGEQLAATTEYAIKGIAVIITLGGITLPLYLLATADSNTQGMVGTATVVIIVGYAGLVALGYAGDRVYSYWMAHHDEYAEQYESESVEEASD